MHGRQELQSKGSLEPLNQIRHSLETFSGRRPLSKKRFCVLNRTRDELDAFARGVSAIAISSDKVTFDRPEDMP